MEHVARRNGAEQVNVTSYEIRLGRDACSMRPESCAKIDRIFRVI